MARLNLDSEGASQADVLARGLLIDKETSRRTMVGMVMCCKDTSRICKFSNRSDLL